jgi:hypothetical protein
MPAKAKAKPKLKDPKGGLTEAGREQFKKSQGAHLKPGVKSVKTPEDMKRKGSFLRRHYGKKAISPLIDAKGKPTRFALQAHAWGEPVPKTQAAVTKLAEKGTALLEKYHKTQEAGERKSRSGK